MLRWSLVTALICLISVNAFAAVSQVDEVKLLPLTVQSRSINDNELTLDLVLDSPSWITVSDYGDPLQVAEFPGAGSLEEEGYPLVPIVGRMFRVPPRSGIVIEVIDSEYETLTNVEYAALYSSGELDEEYGEASIIRDEWYPGILAEVSEPDIFHDFRVSRLQTYPVQVNTSRQEVRIYHNIQVAIRFEGEDNRNTISHWPTSISEAFLPWYQLFLDWDENELDEYTLYRGHVQVVMRDNDVLMDLMEPWFEWKRQKGWDLETLTDTDVPNFTASNIRSELVSRYENSDPKFDYVVVVGDETGVFSVPPSTGNGYGNGDHYYANLVGVVGLSGLVDVGIGRISVEQNTHVQTYVNKVLTYERDPDLNNTDWYLRGQVAVASDHSGIGTVFVGRYNRHALLNLGYTQVDTAWVSPWGNGNVNNRSVERINNGVSWYSCRGYISAGLSTNVIANLSNDDMTPVVSDLTCATGDWAGGYGINEAYIRAGTANTARGGIGAVGNATGGTNPRFNNCLGYGNGFSTLVLQNPCLGDMHFGGKVNIYNNFSGLDGNLNNFNQWHNLMGDPTVWVWTSIPQVMTVDAAETIELGQNSLSINVTDDGLPVEGAWVTLYKVDEDEDVIVKGISDSEGNIILNSHLQYTGDAVLTVTKQNYAPVQIDIDVLAPESRIGYLAVSFQDDGADGTTGNDNGIPEAGETVGLVIEAENFGNNQQNNISLTASSTDPWISNIDGVINYGNLASGANSTGDGLILVEIAPAAQHDWIMHLNLEFASDTDTFEDIIPFTVMAPQLAFVEVNGAVGFDPGETTNITVTVKNIGGSVAAPSTVILERIDPSLGIIDEEATFNTIGIGSESTSSLFEISAHPTTIPGSNARARLLITTETGQVDTTYFSISIGTRTSTDPCGPDSYGYYAFDNTDTDYELVPDYDWVEINGDGALDGVELNIDDNGDNQDESIVIDLPFPIQYYGEVFEEATICSNGMMAMGSQADVPNSRNFTIPSPGGPNYMIAPYWDERFITGGAGIYTYHDAANGRFIVEWDAVTDYLQQHPCTFQVIFYTQDTHPTYTGDNEFLFQYENLYHTQGRTNDTSADTYYWTTGIENGNQTDGLLLAYWNRLSPGAASFPTENNGGRSILFTTNVALITGTLEGVVTDIETGFPIEGAYVHTADYVFGAYTNAQGNYIIEEIIINDNHTIVAEAVGYNSGITDGIEVIEDQTTVVNFSLTHPEFDITPTELFMQIPPDDSITQTVTISNDGNGPLDYSFKVLFEDPAENLAANELDDPWDEILTFDLTANESRNRGATFLNENIWVAGSFNADAGMNKLYRYSREGILLNTYDQPVANHSIVGFYGITTDGQYLYGADRGYIYQMTYTGTDVIMVQRWRILENNVRYITYDSDRNYLWVGNLESVSAYDMEGNLVLTYEFDIDARGLGYHPDDAQGYPLYFICSDIEEADYRMKKMNPENGNILSVYDFPGEGSPLGSDITNKYDPLRWTYISVMDSPGQDYIQIWEVDINTRWIDIDPMAASIEPQRAGNVDITVSTSSLPTATYYAWLELKHNAIEQTFILPLEIEVSDPEPDHFQPVEATGRPYIILVDGLSINDEMIENHAEIGVFDGELCVGAGVVTGDWPLVIIASEGITVNDVVLPGFTMGNPISYRVYDNEENLEYNASAQYSTGDGNFGTGAFSQINLTAPQGNVIEVIIPFRQNYFELISLYVEPDDLDADAIFGDVNNLVIVYQIDGSIYIPDNFNNIGDISLTQGYLAFCTEDDQMRVYADRYANPEAEFQLFTNTWNWLAYPFPYEIPVGTALENAADEISIVMNNDGEFWIPGIANSLGNLEPGRAYYVYVRNEVTFQYNNPGMAIAGSEVIDIPEVNDAPAATGKPWPVLVTLSDEAKEMQPATIEILDGNILVGKALVLDNLDFVPVITWQGNEEFQLEGFNINDEMSFVVRSSDGTKLPIVVNSEETPKFGEGAYGSVTLERSALPNEFSVSQGYPNPFNPSVTVPFAIPATGEVSFAVYNVLGQQVYAANKTLEAGYHRFMFSTDQSGRDLVSGMYFLKVNFEGENHTQKLMLLK